MHHWLSTDETGSDSCLLCGTVAPDLAEPGSVLSDHGPLPWWCPGNTVKGPHHFAIGYVPDSIECVHCTYIIAGDGTPGEMEWECGQPDGSNRDEWLDYHYPGGSDVSR